MRKRIVHIITGLDDGGAEAVLYRLCVADTSHQHIVISLMDSGKYGPLLETSGVQVATIGLTSGKVTLAGFFRLCRVVRNLRPDVVQTWMYHADLLGGVASRLVGVRNVNWGIHNTLLDPERSPRSTIVVAKVCALLSRFIPRHIVCCAEKSRQEHIRLGYHAARMKVIPNGYDITVFKPDADAGKALRHELGICTNVPVIGFVARFDPMKDHHNLLEALAALRAFGTEPICLLIGNGLDPTNSRIIDWISQYNLGGQVRLLGRRNDIPAVMNALDLHVMSSLSEAFPNVLAEAMACGTLCVSTDVGDAAEIVGTTGRIVPRSNPMALAVAIEEMLEVRSTTSWATRSAEARQHVAESFSLVRMVDAYHSIWDGTFSSNGSID